MTPSCPTTKKPNNVVQQIERVDLQFIILAFVDRLQDDARLSQLFGRKVFDTNDLIAHQEAFLLTAFSSSKAFCEINGYIELRFYNLMNRGFNENHFDMLVNHFIESLEDAWINDRDIHKEAFQTLQRFRPIFEKRENGTRGVYCVTDTIDKIPQVISTKSKLNRVTSSAA